MTLRVLGLHLFSLSLLAVCVALAAGPRGATLKVRLRLVDAATGKATAGIIRATPPAGGPLPLASLLPRDRGLQLAADYRGWHVVPAAGAEIELPRGALRLEALAGLETGRAQQEIDLDKKPAAEIAIPLDVLFRPEEHGLVAGNTHLHLMKLTRPEADQYLERIPAADGLRVLFLSYLERHKDDATYITNEYPVGDLAAFRATGVLFNNGEEHRHNFKGYGEGFGHVMFLNLRERILPASLGSGITGAGFDDRPLRDGIDAARRQGATILWCHNTFGYEDVPSAMTGRLHALNVCDGSRRGGYEDTYYRYLNIGLRLPISTGTDWFIYDFSRVYAKLDGPLTIAAWLEALKAGRAQVTNGPLLSLKVDGHEPGAILTLAQPRTVKIEATALGRHDFRALQLVHNGKVVRQVGPARRDPFRAELVHEVRLDGPGWFALRIDSTTKNELGQPLFAHTSPIYVDYQGRRLFDPEAALALLRQVEEGQAAIREQGAFSSDESRRRILALYDEAARELRTRIERRD
jgi:hypothetical protein